MKLLLVRCGICTAWHGPNNHCPYCGAYHVHLDGKVQHWNVRGVEMKRVVPAKVVNRFIDWVRA